MNRRLVLVAAGVSLTGGLAGCLDIFTDGSEDDNGDDEENNGEDTNDHDEDVVLYEELPAYDQRFVDEAMDTHIVRWIVDNGDPIYFERYEDGHLELIEDPLLEEGVSSDLEAVFGGKHLKIDDTRYEFLVSVGSHQIGNTYGSSSGATCQGDVIEFDDLSADLQELVEFLTEEGEMSITDPDYADILPADFYLPIEAEVQIDLLQTFTASSGPPDCLSYGSDLYEIDLVSMITVTETFYELERVTD